MTVAKVLRGRKETSGREMNPKSSLKRNRARGAFLEYLTTCVPGRSSARKSQLKYTCTYVAVHTHTHTCTSGPGVVLGICKDSRRCSASLGRYKYQSGDKLSPLSTSFIVVAVQARYNRYAVWIIRVKAADATKSRIFVLPARFNSKRFTELL